MQASPGPMKLSHYCLSQNAHSLDTVDTKTLFTDSRKSKRRTGEGLKKEKDSWSVGRPEGFARQELGGTWWS